MDFITFVSPEEKIERVGLRFCDSNAPDQFNEPSLGLILDLEKAIHLLSEEKNETLKIPNLQYLIENFTKFSPFLDEIKRLFDKGEFPHQNFFTETDTFILSPIPKPISIRDGYAFKEHVQTSRKARGLDMIPEFDEFPVFYFSNTQAVTGAGKVNIDTIQMEKLDYELEVAVVIGNQIRNPSLKEADEAIFGLMIMNDWSARHLQAKEMKLNLGPAKGKDFATSFGPYLVPISRLKENIEKTESGSRFHLNMHAKVNGESLSEGHLSTMHWTFAQIIQRAAQGVTLYPGEIIGSGTVGTGCLMELNLTGKTQNKWLQSGDQVDLEVEQLGKLSNIIHAHKAL